MYYVSRIEHGTTLQIRSVNSLVGQFLQRKRFGEFCMTMQQDYTNFKELAGLFKSNDSSQLL